MQPTGGQSPGPRAPPIGPKFKNPSRPERKGDWRCKKCNFRNFSYSKSCSGRTAINSCKAPKPEEEPRGLIMVGRVTKEKIKGLGSKDERVGKRLAEVTLAGFDDASEEDSRKARAKDYLKQELNKSINEEARMKMEWERQQARSDALRKLISRDLDAGTVERLLQRESMDQRAVVASIEK